MRYSLIIISLLLFSCGDNRSLSDQYENDGIMETQWTPPIDTLNVIQENYWEARLEAVEGPIYLYPLHFSNKIFGFEYNDLETSGDTLFFGRCYEGKEHEFKTIISRITEDSLILTFVNENEFLMPIGSQLAFRNDRKDFQEGYDLEKISFTTADPFMNRSCFSVEFDSSTFIYKDRYINGGGDQTNCHKGETPKTLFEDVQEMLSKINLATTFTGVNKDRLYLEPYKLLVKHNGKTEQIEGNKFRLHPRMVMLLDRIESGGPRNREFLEMLGFSLASDPELTRLTDHKFEVGEILIVNEFPEIIEDEVEPTEEIEAY